MTLAADILAADLGDKFRANLARFLASDPRDHQDIAVAAFGGSQGTAHRALNRLMSGETEPRHANIAALCVTLKRTHGDFYLAKSASLNTIPRQ